MLSLFPWSFPSPLTAFDPNSANLNTIPARLHARERRDIQGKTLMSASTPLHVPHPSDKLLFHRHQSLTGCYGKCGLPTCPLSKELKWYLTDFSMDYCWQTASQRCWYHLWHIPKRITLNIHCGPVLSDSDPITFSAPGHGHLGTYCLSWEVQTYLLLSSPGQFTSGESTSTYLTPGQTAFTRSYWSHTVITTE